MQNVPKVGLPWLDLFWSGWFLWGSGWGALWADLQTRNHHQEHCELLARPGNIRLTSSPPLEPVLSLPHPQLKFPSTSPVSTQIPAAPVIWWANIRICTLFQLSPQGSLWTPPFLAKRRKEKFVLTCVPTNRPSRLGTNNGPSCSGQESQFCLTSCGTFCLSQAYAIIHSRKTPVTSEFLTFGCFLYWSFKNH